MARRKRPVAFTLVELLVVVGIVAVLISILMPALSRIRRAADTATCLATLRGIGQAMAIYLSENRGAIPGSGNTSGRHLWVNNAGVCELADPTWNIHNIAGPIECNDYIYPLARSMRLSSPELDGANGVRRFEYYLKLKHFRCPSTFDTLSMADPVGETSLGSLPALSYVTANGFLTIDWTHHAVLADVGFQGNVVCLPWNTTGPFRLPPYYFPRVTKIGATAEKIYMADGTRRIGIDLAGASIIGPRYRLSANPHDTRTHYSSFSDIGAFYGDSAAFLRHYVTGNTTNPVTVDPRPISYRHGATRAYQPAGTYRFNALFFDGHAETLDEINGGHPRLWLPRGTHVSIGRGVGGNTNIAGAKVVWRDIQDKLMPGTWSNNFNGRIYTVP